MKMSFIMCNCCLNNCFLIISWYHDNLNRDKAEDMLKRVRKNGAYLVRRKESEQATDGSESNNRDVFDTQDDKSSYAISFRSVQSLPYLLVFLKL